MVFFKRPIGGQMGHVVQIIVCRLRDFKIPFLYCVTNLKTIPSEKGSRLSTSSSSASPPRVIIYNGERKKSLEGVVTGGSVAEWLARRTRNSVVPGSSPALATCWICSR